MSSFCMDFDALHRDNLALFSNLFEETPYMPQMDIHEVLSSASSNQYPAVEGPSSLSPSSSLSNPCSIFYSTFYDPFDPCQASFGSFGYDNLHHHMHGSQGRRFVQTMDDSYNYQMSNIDNHHHHPLEYLQAVSSTTSQDNHVKIFDEIKENSDPCLLLDDCSNDHREANLQTTANMDDDRDMGKNKPKDPAKRKRIVNKKSEIIKGQWTPEEDGLLVELVEKHGVRKWSSIAQMLPGRIGKQCRERWHNHLKPNIKKDRWSEEEDRILIEAHRQLGNKWAEIARSLPGRSENTIKNHWNATKRRQLSSRKNSNTQKSSSPLQNYIKSVISTSDDKGSLDISSSSTSASPADITTVISHNKPEESCSNLNNNNVAKNQSIVGAGDESFKLLSSSLDAQMYIQFDLQKEMDFMEMLSFGYI